MERFKSVDISNPGHELDPITIENCDSSGIKIIPYHKLEGGTHKMVSCAGMFQRIPESAQELIESTSGNTGYASAYYAQKIGMPIRVYMPEGMASKKINMLEELGANIIQTPRIEYTAGARNRAQAYFDEDLGSRWFFNQSKNPGNWGAHKELAYKLSDTDQLALIGGTCGAIAGLGQRMKEENNAIITEIDLTAGPHFQDKKHGRSSQWKDHGIVGAAPSKMSKIGEDFFKIMDRTAVVDADECEALFREALKCNLDAGKSSIVNLAVAVRIAIQFNVLVGTATFDDVDRYKEIGNRTLDSFDFDIDHIVKFLRSEIVRIFSIHMEDLRSEQIYTV